MVRKRMSKRDRQNLQFKQQSAKLLLNSVYGATEIPPRHGKHNLIFVSRLIRAYISYKNKVMFKYMIGVKRYYKRKLRRRRK